MQDSIFTSACLWARFATLNKHPAVILAAFFHDRDFQGTDTVTGSCCLIRSQWELEVMFRPSLLNSWGSCREVRLSKLYPVVVKKKSKEQKVVQQRDGSSTSEVVPFLRGGLLTSLLAPCIFIILVWQERSFLKDLKFCPSPHKCFCFVCESHLFVSWFYFVRGTIPTIIKQFIS